MFVAAESASGPASSDVATVLMFVVAGICGSCNQSGPSVVLSSFGGEIEVLVPLF